MVTVAQQKKRTKYHIVKQGEYDSNRTYCGRSVRTRKLATPLKASCEQCLKNFMVSYPSQVRYLVGNNECAKKVKVAIDSRLT